MPDYVTNRVHDYESRDRAPVHERANWEFQAVVRGVCAPILGEAGPELMRKRHIRVFPPSTAHGWAGVKGRLPAPGFPQAGRPSEDPHRAGRRETASPDRPPFGYEEVLHLSPEEPLCR